MRRNKERKKEIVPLIVHVIPWEKGDFYAEGQDKCQFCDFNRTVFCPALSCYPKAREDGKNVVFKFYKKDEK